MESIIKEYLEWKGTYARRASVNYKIWVERFVEVCGNKPLEAYEVSDITKFYNWIDDRYSSYTVEYATIIIKNFFQFCKMKNYQCLSSYFIKLPRMKAKSHRAITEDEYKRIIAEIPSKGFLPLRSLVVISLLWDTGVRVSELCDLNLVQISEGKRSTVIQTKKNGKRRIIFWSEKTHRILMQYMKERLELKDSKTSALFIGWCKNKGWSFRLTTRAVQRDIKYYKNRAGIQEKISPHSFRHGWAHKRRDNNAPLAFIQKGLGHVSPVSTFVYEQYNDREFEKNAQFYLK